MRLALVGATGLVGKKMLQVLEEQKVEVEELIPVGSERSVGKHILFNNKEVRVISLQEAVSRAPDYALFSAGGDVSKEWAPAFASKGTVVIDNSSAWRMEPGVPLIVPEVNMESINSDSRIIANPNCSTIQMVMALKPLRDKYGIERVVVSTYQSITGSGYKALDQMNAERLGKEVAGAYPHPIDQNCIPQCDVFLDNGYTKEEMKLVNETRKILNEASLPVTATAVRVPVVGGHSESINVELSSPFELAEVRRLLEDTAGIAVIDNPGSSQYPMPLHSHDKDEVFVGRLRIDESRPNSLNMWIVADNLRKGAATNAVQILKHLALHQLKA